MAALGEERQVRDRLVGEASRTSREVRDILMVGEAKVGEAMVKEAIRTTSLTGGPATLTGGLNYQSLSHSPSLSTCHCHSVTVTVSLTLTSISITGQNTATRHNTATSLSTHCFH